MAINILLITPISDKAEHVFLGAQRTILYNHARLRIKTIKMTKYLRSWNKNNLICKVYII